MSIIEQLTSYDFFTSSEKAIIKVIFQDTELLKKSTAQELAKAAFTSASTVARLCQKLGCKNYNEFRMQFIAEMEKRQYENTFINASIPFKKNDTPEEILKQLTKLQNIALQETLSLINLENYQRAVQMLANAESIDIYGMGINLHLAYDFAYKMARIHRPVHICLDHQQQLLAAATPAPNHCAILISYSGETTDSIRYASLLHKNKTPLITITSIGNNSVSQYADERLYIASMEKQFSKIGPFASCISISTILNYLYAGIFSLDYDENYQKLLSTVLSVTEFRSQYGPLREEQ